MSTHNVCFHGEIRKFLNDSFAITAPSIYENDDIKKGILLQLFGGTRKDFTHAGRGKFRYVHHSFNPLKTE